MLCVETRPSGERSDRSGDPRARQAGSSDPVSHGEAALNGDTATVVLALVGAAGLRVRQAEGVQELIAAEAKEFAGDYGGSVVAESEGRVRRLASRDESHSDRP